MASIGQIFPSMLWHCWLGDRKGILTVKSWGLVCWWWRFDRSFACLMGPVVTTKKSKRETFWYQLIQFHLDKGWEDGESISVKSCHSWAVSYFASHCMMVQVKFMLLIYRGFTFYKMSNLDNRIANADQLLTQDVEKLSNSIAELYSNLSKVGSSFVCFGFKLWSAVFSHPYRCNFLPRLLSIQI